MKKIVKAVEKIKQEHGGYMGNLALKSGGSLASGHSAGNIEVNNIKPNPVGLRKNRVLIGEEMESATMAYNMLRTQVYKAMVKNGWNNVGVTSSNKSEGKSLTALNLALSLARSVQQTVVLIDFDLRRPSIHKKLDYEPKVGLSDYYTNNKPLAEMLITPDVEGLVVIPGRESLNNASELLASPKTPYLLNELNRIFSPVYMIFDLPPVLLVDDVMALSDYIDSTLLVVSEGTSKKEELTQTVELLGGANLLGTVLNNSGESRSGGGYYDYYYGAD
jgi:capsular exopolysaccharide synthesis family protein